MHVIKVMYSIFCVLLGCCIASLCRLALVIFAVGREMGDFLPWLLLCRTAPRLDFRVKLKTGKGKGGTEQEKKGKLKKEHEMN